MKDIYILTQDMKDVLESTPNFLYLSRFLADTEDSHPAISGTAEEIIAKWGFKKSSKEDVLEMINVFGWRTEAPYAAATIDEGCVRRLREDLNTIQPDTCVFLGDIFCYVVRRLAEEFDPNVWPPKITANPTVDAVTNIVKVAISSRYDRRIDSIRIYEKYNSNGDKYNIKINGVNEAILTPIAGKVKAGDLALFKIDATLANGVEVSSKFSIQL
ncbi:TPA: hypothetical protein ACNEJR_003641 [Escherichia coli]